MLHYRSVIKGAPRPRQRAEREYWALVNELMGLGWYRLGEGRDASGPAWGFRAGHTVSGTGCGGCSGRPARRPDERWIMAKSEITAMRRLLRELDVPDETAKCD
jgi:hypothetical protein